MCTDRTAALTKALATLKVPLLSVISLPVFILHSGRAAFQKETTVTVLQIVDDLTLVMAWKNGALIYDYYRTSLDEASGAVDFSRRYLGLSVVPALTRVDCRYEATKKSFRLPRLTEEPKDLFIHTESGKAAVTIRAVWNSLNAIAMLLISVAGLLGLTATIGWLLLPTSDVDIDRYQTVYQERDSLSREVDSLRTVIKNSESAHGATSAAATFSAFCQESRTDLYLTNITLTSHNPKLGSGTVTASGAAKKEVAIFEYYEVVKPHLRPLNLTLDLITPTIVSEAGRPDTVMQFQLRSLLAP
jgi:hypothetical protein